MNSTDDNESEDSDLQVILSDGINNTPPSNNDNEGEETYATLSKPAIKIDIESIMTRDATKDSKQQCDWKKWLLYPSVLIDYVTKHKILKKVILIQFHA